MEVNLWLSIVQLQSEYVRRLATDLTTTLNSLEQRLKEQQDHPYLTTNDYEERIAEGHRLLMQEIAVLLQRLRPLREPSSAPDTQEALPTQGAGSTSRKREEDAHLDPAAVLPLRSAQKREFFQRVHALIDDSRDTMASAHQTFTRTRALLQRTEELFQHVRAFQEREAEIRAERELSHLATPIQQNEPSLPEHPFPSESSRTNKTE